MKKKTVLQAITGVLFFAAFLSCNTSDKKTFSALGEWRVDSITHPTNAERASRVSLLIGMSAGPGPLYYAISKDSLRMHTNKSNLDSNSYRQHGDTLLLNDEDHTRYVLKQATDSVLQIMAEDSLTMHLTRNR